MSGASGYLLGIELRRHRREVALIAVLVAVVTGTVLASLAGAQRSRTAFDRYLELVNPPEAEVSGSPEALAALEALPSVAHVLPYEAAAAFFVGEPEDYFPVAVAGDDRLHREVNRFPLVSGRYPDPSAPLEVVMSLRTADRLGVGVGDVVPTETISPTQIDRFNETGEFDPDGPRLEMEVVGIVRDPGDIASRAADLTITFLTPAFRDRFDETEIGSMGAGALLDLEEGATLRDLAGPADDLGVELATTVFGDFGREQADPTMRAIATSLQVFAVVVALAGLAATAHVVGRAQQSAARDDPALAALGFGRASRAVRLAGPGVLAVVAGSATGVLVAIGASGRFPVGLARIAEPDPGLQVDARTLALGALAAALLGTVLVVGLAARRTQVTPPAMAASPWPRAAAAAGAPATIVAGLTFATGRGRGTGTPGRATLVGTALGVVGVIAAATFGASVDQLVSRPQLYGWGWDANIAGAELSGLPEDRLDSSALVDDPDLAAVAEAVFQIAAEVDDSPEQVIAVTDLMGHVGPVVVRGREPLGDDEIALGAATLERAGRRIGDEVAVDLGRGPVTMRVTGVVSLPVPSDGGSSASGAFLTGAAAAAAGFDGTCDGEEETCYRNAAVRVRPGVDVAEVVHRYTDREADIAVDLPAPPGEVERLVAVETLPRYLALFLAVLAAVAAAYAASTTVHRRRGDLAVLRTVGMTGQQLRGVVTVQVLSLTAVGALLGAVLGIVAGRQIWRFVAESISMPNVPSVPLSAVVGMPLAALLVAHLAASSSRHAAGHLPVAATLRVE